MHAAPSVSYPVGRSRFAGGLLAALWLLALAAALGWLLAAATSGWRQGLVLLATCGSGLLAALAWRRSPVGVLAWDAGRWEWQPRAGAAAPGRVELALDLQERMLLRWQPAGARAAWLWVERKAAPSHWPALRRAVYSPANNDAAPHGDPPPVAER